jgi:pyridoxamine 5'-phosphate oxidase
MPPKPNNLGNLDQSDSAPARDSALADPLPKDPFAVFVAWFDKATKGRIQPNPNAFTLATVGKDNRPSARIVLCKGVDPAAGHIVFYTNYRGRKGRDLDAHPWASAVFHWDTLDKQVRMEGPVVKSPAAESDAYFASRPLLSRIGAWVSDQSEPISSRAALEAKLDATLRRFNLDPANMPSPTAKIDIPRPPHWGGYRLCPQRMELWSAGAGRLHDRAAWTREVRPAGDKFECGPWTGTRLQP